jgi:hypothetical protein
MKSGCSGAGDWHANINQEGWRGTSVLKNRFLGDLDWEWEVMRQERDRHFLSDHHQ